MKNKCSKRMFQRETDVKKEADKIGIYYYLCASCNTYHLTSSSKCTTNRESKRCKNISSIINEIDEKEDANNLWLKQFNIN